MIDALGNTLSAVTTAVCHLIKKLSEHTCCVAMLILPSDERHLHTLRIPCRGSAHVHASWFGSNLAGDITSASEEPLQSASLSRPMPALGH